MYSVPRLAKGTSYFFLICLTPGTDPHNFQLDPDPAIHAYVDRDLHSAFHGKKLIIVGRAENHSGCCSQVIAYIIGNGFSFKHT